MNPAYPDYAHRLGQLTGQGVDANSTLANIYQGVVQQATLLSYLDAFRALALVFIAFLPVLLLLKSGKGGASPALH
jgi:DHA2 family multidrug resistance protein